MWLVFDMNEANIVTSSPSNGLLWILFYLKKEIQYYYYYLDHPSELLKGSIWTKKSYTRWWHWE